MKIALVHNTPVEGKLDSIDVLDQVEMVSAALSGLDYSFKTFPVGEGACPVSDLINELKAYSPDAVFNLFEGLSDDPRFYPMVASIFEAGGFPYTGAPFPALFTTTDKILSKAILQANNLPTPEWQQYDGSFEAITIPPPWIVKPSWEDGSIGIDEDSIYYGREGLISMLPLLYERHRCQPLLIERYIEGREINIPLLEHGDGSVEVLPISEITFEDWPPDKPRIVGYKAKWNEGAFEYENTQRVFYPEEAPLELMEEVAMKCWKLFHLGGYARVDARLDEHGNLYIIEINTNPCIASESGFMRATYEAGYRSLDFVREVIAAAIRRRNHPK
ncbi:MAG: ATP-grasp domain-containing protein [Syntrophales bacterium]